MTKAESSLLRNGVKVVDSQGSSNAVLSHIFSSMTFMSFEVMEPILNPALKMARQEILDFMRFVFFNEGGKIGKTTIL